MIDVKALKINVDKNINQYLEILETTRIQIAWYDADDYKKMLIELFKTYESNKVIKN